MQNISGRINSANITNQEWNVLLKVYNQKGDFRKAWYTPTPQDWLFVGGLQLGIAQIRLNEHGLNAVWHHLKGEIYISGPAMTETSIKAMLIADGLNPQALFPDGFDLGEDEETTDYKLREMLDEERRN